MISHLELVTIPYRMSDEDKALMNIRNSSSLLKKIKRRSDLLQKTSKTNLYAPWFPEM